MNNPAFKNYRLARTAIPVPVYQTPSKRSKTAATSISEASTMSNSQHHNFKSPVPKVTHALISFPTPHTLLIVLNRPKSLNCINTAGHYELDALFTWYDAEPSLRAAIITGTGRAFCAGADLKEWSTNLSNPKSDDTPSRKSPPGGFGGLSTRKGKKPVIAAVNGLCLGGGCEMIVNADIVLASEKAIFALPEVKRGVVALAGALPRIVRTIGRQRAMEMALTGRNVDAREAESWGLVNRVVGAGGTGADSEVVAEAVKIANEIGQNSPDSVVVSREGIKLGWDGLGVEGATEIIRKEWYPRIDGGDNMKEGLKAFVEKRKPKWVPSKL